MADASELKVNEIEFIELPRMEWCIECGGLEKYNNLEFCEICGGPICKTCVNKKGNNMQIEYVICKKCENI